MNCILLDSYLNYLEETDLLELSFPSGTYSKIQKSVSNNISTLSKYLKKEHKIDINAIKIDAKKTATLVSRKLEKANIDTKNISKEIVEKNEIFVEHELEKLSIPSSIVHSISILITVLYLSFVAIFLCGLLLGPQIGAIVSCCVIVPFIEEAGKNIAVIGKYPWIYTTIFASFEFFSYMFLPSLQSISLSKKIFLRSFALIMHFMTTLSQKVHFEKGKEIDEHVRARHSLIIGTLLHAFFNSVAVIAEKYVLTI